MIRWTVFLACCWVFTAQLVGQTTANPMTRPYRLAAFTSSAYSAAANEKLTLGAKLVWEEGHLKGQLVVTAKMIPGWHVYSMDQVGGPGPSKLKIEESVGIKVTGSFTADRAPDVSDSTVWPGVSIEEFSDEVSWSAPVEWELGKPGPLAAVKIRYDGICCDSSAGCVPYNNQKLAVEWKNPDPAVAATKNTSANNNRPAAAEQKQATDAPTSAPIPPEFAKLKIDQEKIDHDHSSLTGTANRSVIKPGEQIKLQFSFEVFDEYHIYQWLPNVSEKLNYSPTLIKLQPTTGFKVVDVQASLPVSEKDTAGVYIAYYEGNVELEVTLEALDTVSAGEYTIRGAIGYQTCNADRCDMPTGAGFSIPLKVVSADQPAPAKIQTIRFANSSYDLARIKLNSWASAEPGLVFVVKESEAAPPAASAGGNESAPPTAISENGNPPAGNYSLRLEAIKSRGVSQEHLSIPMALGLALLGGFILNFMPCVLPVIGLKVMSFVQQAGSNRFQAFMLNVWYTVGILAVFMILATMLVFFNFGWGQQSQFASFQIGLAAIVFVMALSFLGVWEIPIPGFVGSSKAAQAAEREGPIAAIIKGVITTILAVPCSGPALAAALAWCTGRPAYLVYLVFLFMGLGMALPYIILGLNPSLVKLIPRPGMWMEQFKQFMGFVLLGTVIWLLWTIPIALMLPAVAFLFGLWFACWWIGTTSITATTTRRGVAWLVAIAIGIGSGWFAFQTFFPALEGKVGREMQARILRGFEFDKDHLDWQPYSFASLAQHAEEGRTVMVDFTADWCQTCKVLEQTVLNTDKVKKEVESLGIVSLMADWTYGDEDVTEMLKQFGSKQIPVLAVFPAGRATEPIVLIGGYSQSYLLEVLREAGPSKAVAGQPSEKSVDNNHLSQASQNTESNSRFDATQSNVLTPQTN